MTDHDTRDQDGPAVWTDADKAYWHAAKAQTDRLIAEARTRAVADTYATDYPSAADVPDGIAAIAYLTQQGEGSTASMIVVDAAGDGSLQEVSASEALGSLQGTPAYQVATDRLVAYATTLRVADSIDLPTEYVDPDAMPAGDVPVGEYLPAESTSVEGESFMVVASDRATAIAIVSARALARGLGSGATDGIVLHVDRMVDLVDTAAWEVVLMVADGAAFAAGDDVTVVVDARHLEPRQGVDRRNLIAEASTIGLRPGVWPDRLIVRNAPVGDTTYRRTASVGAPDNLVSVVYSAAQGGSVEVLND